METAALKLPSPEAAEQAQSALRALAKLKPKKYGDKQQTEVTGADGGPLTLADEILDIANTPVVGVKTKTNEKGEVETTEGDMIEHRRLQVDARKWIAAKLKPKKYGDKQEIEHSGNVSVIATAHDENL
jgi:hypothetical protein